MIGYAIVFGISTLLLISQSITMAFQNIQSGLSSTELIFSLLVGRISETAGISVKTTCSAYISVVCFVIGKGFGLVWSASFMFLFPIEHFGFVFGFMNFSSMPIS